MDEERREHLEQALPDGFSRDLLDGALRVLADQGNPMRAHLFAAALRELFTYLLHNAAPDDEVRACAWFQQAPDTPGVTRRQRAIYASQGGLSDEYVANLGVDVAELHRQAINAIDALNRATHVRPGRVLADAGEIAAFVEPAVSALEGLLEAFRTCRETVKDVLENEVYNLMMAAFVEQTFGDIDLIASHGYEVDPFIAIATIDVTDITSSEIQIVVEGEAPVTLHYGRGDDAVEIGHDFPFTMRFTAPTDAPGDVAYSDGEIDDSGWYGDGDDDE